MRQSTIGEETAIHTVAGRLFVTSRMSQNGECPAELQETDWRRVFADERIYLKRKDPATGRILVETTRGERGWCDPERLETT